MESKKNSSHKRKSINLKRRGIKRKKKSKEIVKPGMKITFDEGEKEKEKNE